MLYSQILANKKNRPDHITDSSSGSSANSSLASLYDRLQTNCPSPALSNSTPRLVVRVGDAADENVFRLSYLLSSFTVMVRDVARKKKNQNDAVPVPASIQPQQKPKMRKRAQKEFGDLLSSFGN